MLLLVMCFFATISFNGEQLLVSFDNYESIYGVKDGYECYRHQVYNRTNKRGEEYGFRYGTFSVGLDRTKTEGWVLCQLDEEIGGCNVISSLWSRCTRKQYNMKSGPKCPRCNGIVSM